MGGGTPALVPGAFWGVRHGQQLTVQEKDKMCGSGSKPLAFTQRTLLLFHKITSKFSRPSLFFFTFDLIRFLKINYLVETCDEKYVGSSTKLAKILGEGHSLGVEL